MNIGDWSDLIGVITGIIGMPTALGVVFAVLIQPRGTYVNLLFALFAGSVALWCLASVVNGLNVEWVAAKEQFYFQVSGLFLTMAGFTLFVTGFSELKRSYTVGIYIATGVFVPLVLTLMWRDRLIDWHSSGWEITSFGYLVYGYGAVVFAICYWLIHIKQEAKAHALRLPTLLLNMGVIGNFLPYLGRTSFDIFMAVVATLYTGWIVLRFQLFNPLHELNERLTRINEALIDANLNLAEEKEKVEGLNIDLQRANDYKSAFLANMSHELRTPLNSIIGYSELLIKNYYGAITEQQEDRLEKIYRNGTNLLMLINDILDLSKIEAGQIVLNKRKLNLLDLVPTLLETIEPLAQHKGLRLLLEVPHEVYPVSADDMRMRQVFTNLLSNAVKFTHQGAVTLRLQNIQLKPDATCPPDLAELPTGDWLVACVEDTGIGIAPENLERIFQEFIQADGSTTREYGGTGLGLAIARRFVEMHDGKLWVMSSLGQGSRFYMALPALAPLPLPPLPSVAYDGRLDGEPDKQKVLVIDDSSEAAEILVRHLEQAGYDAVWAEGGMRGLELAQNFRPDVITVDIQMPGMDGWEVIARLKSNQLTAQIPVVVVSIFEQMPYGMPIGASAYIPKPVVPEMLMQALQNIRREGNAPILVADDDANEREIITIHLQRENFRVVATENGQQALDWLQDESNNCCLLILDLMMPLVSGFEVLQYVRSQPRLQHLPVLIVTSKILEQQEREFLLSHTAQILEKHGLNGQNLMDYIRLQIPPKQETAL